MFEMSKTWRLGLSPGWSDGRSVPDQHAARLYRQGWTDKHSSCMDSAGRVSCKGMAHCVSYGAGLPGPFAGIDVVDVAPQQDLYTQQGVAVTVELSRKSKVKSDRESVLTAAEHFLTKTDQKREGLIRLVMKAISAASSGSSTWKKSVKQPERWSLTACGLLR